MTSRNPFLGARPYALVESTSFFGRDKATRDLTHLIELHPVVAVVAPSGIGKTSLLRASVIPELERRGLLPVYLRPDPKPDSGNDGARALLDGRMEQAMIDALLPDVDLELLAFETIAEAWGPISLSEAAKRFRGLNAADDARTALLESRGDIVERHAMTARFLNGTFDRLALAKQWGQLDKQLGDAIAEEAHVSELARLLRKPQVRANAGSIKDRLVKFIKEATVPFDVLRMLTAAEELEAFQLIRPDGDIELKPRIVLVIDQFEQVFTLASQENRERLLIVLANLADAELPVHLVFSLRKEWYADLIRQFVRFRSFTPAQSFETFHLDSMTLAEARNIMIDVPKSVGEAPISHAWQEQILTHLQTGEFIDAVTLSIACHELFDTGRDMGDEMAEEDVLEALGVEDLLESYLNRALHSLEDHNDVDEAIDILSDIAGSGTTRDFVTHSRILSAPLRDKHRRQHVLARLQGLFLIRADNPRPGSEKLYDIMHERLIEPVRALIGTRSDILGLRGAADRIVSPDAAQIELDFEDLRAILGARDRLQLDARTAGILLNGLLRLDWRGRDRSRVERLAREAGSSSMETWFIATRDDLARQACAPADGGSVTARLRADWWLTEPELADALAQMKRGSVQEDHLWLVINTLLRRTPGAGVRAMMRDLLSNAGTSND